MPMLTLGETATRNPFHDFICDGCGKRLGLHYLYKPEKFADVRPGDKNGRPPDGKLYCSSSGMSHAGSHFQRQLSNIMGDRK